MPPVLVLPKGFWAGRKDLREVFDNAPDSALKNAILTNPDFKSGTSDGPFHRACDIQVWALEEMAPELFSWHGTKVVLFGRVMYKDALSKALKASEGQTVSEAASAIGWIGRAAVIYSQYAAALQSLQLTTRTDICPAPDPTTGCCPYHDAASLADTARAELRSHSSTCPFDIEKRRIIQAAARGHEPVCVSQRTCARYPGLLGHGLLRWWARWSSEYGPTNLPVRRTSFERPLSKSSLQDMYESIAKVKDRAKYIYGSGDSGYAI